MVIGYLACSKRTRARRNLQETRQLRCHPALNIAIQIPRHGSVPVSSVCETRTSAHCAVSVRQLLHDSADLASRCVFLQHRTANVVHVRSTGFVRQRRELQRIVWPSEQACPVRTARISVVMPCRKRSKLSRLSPKGQGSKRRRFQEAVLDDGSVGECDRPFQCNLLPPACDCPEISPAVSVNTECREELDQGTSSSSSFVPASTGSAHDVQATAIPALRDSQAPSEVHDPYDQDATMPAAETNQLETVHHAGRNRLVSAQLAEVHHVPSVPVESSSPRPRRRNMSSDVSEPVESIVMPPRDLFQAGFRYLPNCDYSSHPNVTFGKMDRVCGFCRALKFRREPAGLCCANGKVELLPLLPPPEPLRSLVAGESADSKHFLQNIRSYNSCFQMTSFGATRIIRDNYMPTFKVQGQIYHQLGSFLPVAEREATFLQMYFIGDREQEATQRRRFNSNTKESIVLALQDFFHKHNQLIRVFKIALDQMPSDNYMVIIRPDKAPVGQHAGRYNAPTAAEVAVVMVGDTFNARDIVIHRRHGVPRCIAETNRSYDALQYPILFWQGEDGYHFQLRLRDPATNEQTGKKVSCMKFYAHRLMVRDNVDNHILKCGRVFHQYAVDMYVKIETERLRFIRLNQAQL